MRHYLFVNNEVVACPTWEEIPKYPTGTYGVTPRETEVPPWFLLEKGGTWDYVEPPDVPKEFRMQLLLLGIQIKQQEPN